MLFGKIKALVEYGVRTGLIEAEDTIYTRNRLLEAFCEEDYADEEAEQKILEEYEETLRGTEDEPVLWFALALIEWRKGRLTERVKIKALEWIERGGDLERWETPGNEGNARKRK